MILVLPTKDEIALAKEKSAEMGKLNNSIRSGEGNVYGFLGEIITARVIGAEIHNCYDYDLTIGGYKIDVKTKACTSAPRPDFDCSVAEFNTRQRCDYYIFVRVLEDLSKVWLLGKKSKDSFYKEARHCIAGEVDKKSTFGWRFKANCYNLAIDQLEPIKCNINSVSANLGQSPLMNPT